MPQPLKVGSTVQFVPNTVLDRPDLAAEIGNVCANWNLVENDLMMRYALLMGDYLPKPPGFAPSTHPVAYQVFDSLNAFGPRVELLEKLFAWRTSEAIVKHFRDAVRPQLRKRFVERSVIAHGVWGTCEKYPDALILVPTYRHQMIYKKRDFEDVSRRIIKDRQILGALTTEVYERRK
jgi:hypothetical protein